MSSILRVDQLQTQSGAPVATFDSTGRATFAGGVTLPTFAEASRPTGVPNGTMIINGDTLAIEVFMDGDWNQIGGSGAGKLVEFKIWGAGGGSGTQNRTNTGYHTNTYTSCKEGGAGGFVEASFTIASGTQLILSPGQPGRGGLLDGNPSDARSSSNGGGSGTYSSYDASGSGGGYSGVFFQSKSQPNAVAIAPGGGGGAGGPGYPSNGNDQANGGGGIANANGTGNDGARSYGYHSANAGGGTPTSGGSGGTQSGAPGGGNGSAGSALTGANAVHHRNVWGSGGGGGGGWYGGGSGSNDGNSWSGGGGAAGSAFVRGSGIPTSPSNDALTGVEYISHTMHTQTYGRYGDGSNPGYNSMRMPVGTGDGVYPGNDVGYGGAFRLINQGGPSGYDGGSGAIVYRLDGGPWQTVTYTGSDVTITI